jgi:hypothetical protein
LPCTNLQNNGYQLQFYHPNVIATFISMHAILKPGIIPLTHLRD